MNKLSSTLAIASLAVLVGGCAHQKQRTITPLQQTGARDGAIENAQANAVNLEQRFEAGMNHQVSEKYGTGKDLSDFANYGRRDAKQREELGHASPFASSDAEFLVLGNENNPTFLKGTPAQNYSTLISYVAAVDPKSVIVRYVPDPRRYTHVEFGFMQDEVPKMASSTKYYNGLFSSGKDVKVSAGSNDAVQMSVESEARGLSLAEMIASPFIHAIISVDEMFNGPNVVGLPKASPMVMYATRAANTNPSDFARAIMTPYATGATGGSVATGVAGAYTQFDGKPAYVVIFDMTGQGPRDIYRKDGEIGVSFK